MGRGVPPSRRPAVPPSRRPGEQGQRQDAGLAVSYAVGRRVGNTMVSQVQVAQNTRPTRRMLLAGAGAGAVGGALGVAACGAVAPPPSQSGAAKGTALFWQWGAGYVDGFQ